LFYSEIQSGYHRDTATATAKRKHGRKRPDNERRRQMHKAWRMKQKSPTAAAATAASTTIAAATQEQQLRKQQLLK
jgi:hypothetical protein